MSETVAKDHDWIDARPEMPEPKEPVLKCRNCDTVATNTVPGWRPPTIADPRGFRLDQVECKGPTKIPPTRYI